MKPERIPSHVRRRAENEDVREVVRQDDQHNVERDFEQAPLVRQIDEKAEDRVRPRVLVVHAHMRQVDAGECEQDCGHGDGACHEILGQELCVCGYRGGIGRARCATVPSRTGRWHAARGARTPAARASGPSDRAELMTIEIANESGVSVDEPALAALAR